MSFKASRYLSLSDDDTASPSSSLAPQSFIVSCLPLPSDAADVDVPATYRSPRGGGDAVEAMSLSRSSNGSSVVVRRVAPSSSTLKEYVAKADFDVLGRDNRSASASVDEHTIFDMPLPVHGNVVAPLSILSRTHSGLASPALQSPPPQLQSPVAATAVVARAALLAELRAPPLQNNRSSVTRMMPPRRSSSVLTLESSFEESPLEARDNPLSQ